MEFSNLLKTDDYRRERAVKQQPKPSAPSAWMGSGIGTQPLSNPNHDQLIQILQSSPGMTPELLRTILEDRKNKMATRPIMDPTAVVGGRGAGLFDYRTQL